MSGYHAQLSPSSAGRWTSCTASVGAARGMGDDGNDAARNGTVCHQISEELLVLHTDPQSYLGRVMDFYAEDGEHWRDGTVRNDNRLTASVTVTQEMIDNCITGVSYVQEQIALTGGHLLVEQRVPIGHFTGEADATGSADIIILNGDTLRVSDFKYGRNRVHAYDVLVPASAGRAEVVRSNLQMAAYALGALELYGLFGDFKHVTMTIIQPPIGHVSEYTCTVAELLLVRDFLQAKANETRTNPVFAPSTSACHYCKARDTCKPRENAVLAIALDGFEDVDTATVRVVSENQLGSVYEKIGMLTDFAKDIAKRVYSNLIAGTPVLRNDGSRYKLVAGKRGDRRFPDTTVVDAMLTTFDVPFGLTHETKLVGLTKLEALAKVKRPKKGETAIKPVISADHWAEIAALITQPDGVPSIAHETDPRPEVVLTTLDFDDVQEATSDLFS